MHCHIILLIVSETFGECVTSSARLVWLICVTCSRWSTKYVQTVRGASVYGTTTMCLYKHIYSKMHIKKAPLTQSWSLVKWLLSEDTGVSEGSHCEWQPQVWPWYEIQGCSLRQWGMSDAQVGTHLVIYLRVCVCVYLCVLLARER